MTTAADDSAVEDAFEAVLAGRRVPDGAAGLAAFTGAVRASATEPGRPNAALAELLATGLLTDQSSPSVRTARSAGTSPAGRPSRVRTRRRSAMIFTALIAKFLSAGAVAQAATGATVAVVAFTGVGAVGALPAPVQDTFATVVAELSPLEPPVSEEATQEVVPEEPVTDDVEAIDEVPAAPEVPAAEAAEAEFRAWALEGPAEGESISAWTSEVSKEDVKAWLRDRGMTFGNVVSRWASGKEFSADELEALGAEAEKESGTTEAESDEAESDEAAEDETETETETEVEETEVEDDDDRGARGSGNGKSNGNGKGNGKN